VPDANTQNKRRISQCNPGIYYSIRLISVTFAFVPQLVFRQLALKYRHV